MKKRITKKLALSKETLRNLGAVQLRQAAGGSWGCGTYPCPDYSTPFTCACTQENTVVEPQTRNC